MNDFDLQSCLDGEPNAWAAFVDRFARVIHAAIRRTIGGSDMQLIEDLVQDVFVRLVRDDMRTLRSFDPSRGASLTTWLTIVARSAAIDEMRRRRVDAGSLDTVSNEPGTARTGSVRHEQIIPLEVLTARQRLIMRMLFDEQMSVVQAAAVLGVDDQTVRSTKHKALTRLRNAMADSESSESARTTPGAPSGKQGNLREGSEKNPGIRSPKSP